MGSRKELLKKSLGISEYPWTSDDEMEEPLSRMEEPEMSVLRRQTEPGTSTADMPGTSGLQQIPTSPQENFDGVPTTSSEAAEASTASNRRQAKYERDLFWTMLNNQSARVRTDSPPTRSPSPLPLQNTATIRTKLQLLLPSAHRFVHTPAAEYRDRDRRSIQDIQRILAFKRMTGNMNSLHLNGSHYSMSPHGNPGAPVPSEATSALRVARAGRASIRRYTPLRVEPGYARYRLNAVGSPNEENNEQVIRVRPREATIQDVPTSTAQLRPNINIRPSGEVQETPGPSALPSISEEVILAQDETAEHTSSNNISGVTEEEIVEINPEDAAPAVVEFDDENTNNDVQQNRDPNLASISRDNAELQLVNPTQVKSIQGVKRKRRDSDEYPEPYTVKEFNQDLLRLLECPVCLEWMEPPMSQCRRGHLVCGRCRARLAACPVCRTSFSSVRNRAMEGVAEMLRYPCRHGCGREVRLRRRAPHEASCASRHYLCPAPSCRDNIPLPRDKLAQHFQSKHMQILKIGGRHKFSMKIHTEQHENWLILALNEYFHLRIDVDTRVVVYVAYIGPKCDAKFYNYEVSVEGQNSTRKLVYARSTHSDLESPSLNMSRQDCFHMSTDQALNFIRFKRHNDPERFLDFTVEVTKAETLPVKEESDS